MVAIGGIADIGPDWRRLARSRMTQLRHFRAELLHCGRPYAAALIKRRMHRWQGFEYGAKMSRLNRPIAWLLRVGLAALFAAVTASGTSAATFSALVSTSGADVGVCTSTAPGGGSSSPISANIACLGNGAGGATASASVGHVGASANGLDNGTGVFATAGSAFLIGNVIFTGSDPTAEVGTTNVSLNLSFGGTLSATTSAGAEVRASSDLFGQAIGSVLITDAAGAITCSSTFLGLGTCGSKVQGGISSTSVLVPLNVSVQLALFIDVSAGGGSIGTSGSADFSNSLDLPIGSDVFNLAPGVMVNSDDLGIVDNRFDSATPLPAALPLFATGLGALGLLGWRRKRKAAALAA